MKLSRLIEDLQRALEKKGDVDVVIADPTSQRHPRISVTYDFDPEEPVVIESYIVRGRQDPST